MLHEPIPTAETAPATMQEYLLALANPTHTVQQHTQDNAGRTLIIPANLDIPQEWRIV